MQVLQSPASVAPVSAEAPVSSVPERMARALVAAAIFGCIAVLVFRLWLAEAIDHPRMAQPMQFTVVLCLLAVAALAARQRKLTVGILVMGAAGLIVGLYLFPSTSRVPGTGVAAICSGNLDEFQPFALCLGAFFGTVIGQNLPPLRAGINRLNRLGT